MKPTKSTSKKPTTATTVRRAKKPPADPQQAARLFAEGQAIARAAQQQAQAARSAVTDQAAGR
jgi:hypothetical protein